MQLLRAFIYPVKSLRGVEVSSLELDALGPVGDRRWMVVDARGVFVTQRTVPAMATLQPALEGGALRLHELVVASPPADARRVLVTVWEDTFEALDAGDEAAGWLSERLAKPVRLVAFARDVRREVDPRYAAAAQTGFSDGYPLLIANEASLDALNAQLASPIPMERFRPNLVVRAEAPWAEDGWAKLELDGVRFDGVKPCARCVIINTDQRTGERPHGNAPLKTLGEAHRAVFGMNLVHRGLGRVNVGARVVVG